MKLFYDPLNPAFATPPAYCRQVITVTESYFTGPQANPPTYQGIKNVLNDSNISLYPKAWLAIDLENVTLDMRVPTVQDDTTFKARLENVRFLLKTFSRAIRPGATKRKVGYYSGGPNVGKGSPIIASDIPGWDQRMAILSHLDPYCEFLPVGGYYINIGDPLTFAVGPLNDQYNNSVDSQVIRMRYRRRKPRFRPSSLGAKPMVAWVSFFYQVDGTTKVNLADFNTLINYFKSKNVYGIIPWRGFSAQLPLSDPLVAALVAACDTF